MPGDTAARVHQTKEPEEKNDFDEWLARIICFAFSVPPQWAVKLMNRATADNQSAQSEEEGLAPTKEWVKDLIDEIISEEFSSPDLELVWLDEDDADPKGLESVLEGRVKLGAVTLNEMRDSLGLDPYANAAADRPMVLTATGYVPIEANAGGKAKPNANTQTGLLVEKYSPDQPRVSAGNPDGGQWTTEGESSVGGQPVEGTPAQQASLADAANDNLTPAQVCQQAYADAVALARINPSLSSTDYLLARQLSAEKLDYCLQLANGELPISRGGDFVEFYGGGVVIFRPGRPPLYVLPSGRQ